MKWDLEHKSLDAEITFVRDGEIRIRLPEGFGKADISVNEGNYVLSSDGIIFTGKKGNTLTISCK